MRIPATSADYLDLIQKGLPPRGGPAQKVLVLGAGMAGLTAGYELLRAGHEVEILEAQTRVGGRVFTMREPFSHGLYGEAGAMRIPRAHHLTMAYVEKFGLHTYPFQMGNPKALCCLMGLRLTLEEAEREPDRLGFELADIERGQTSSALWEGALRPFSSRLETVGDEAWTSIVEEFDAYSVREFLEAQRWSEGAIERFGLLANQEALMNSSFLELLREELGNYYTDMVQIEGGMDHLPRAFLPDLAGRIRFGARVVAIEQTPDGVIVHYRTGAGRFAAPGQRAIVTLPSPVLRHVEFLP
ncbi:MAG: FAD-dependent oxidoreductase, partial [Anaerolineales bacterium]